MNGTFILNATTGSVSGTGFSAGDTITVTINSAFGADSLGLTNQTSSTVLLATSTSNGSRTYVVPAATNDTFGLAGTRASPSSNFAWSCVAGAGSGTSATDSEKLGSVQSQGSTVVANNSATAISGSVGSATDAALDPPRRDVSQYADRPGLSLVDFVQLYVAYAMKQPGSKQSDHVRYYTLAIAIYETNATKGLMPIQVDGPEMVIWVTWDERQRMRAHQFAPERTSSVRERADEAFAALGYAAVNKAPSRVATLPASQWLPWLDVRGTGFEQSGSGAPKGTQINATAGLNYRARHNVVVGLFAGYENFNYEFAALSGRLKGDGGTVGVNAGWAITPTLRWKGMIGWTGVGYDATAATAAGSFSGSRWMFSTGLTGRYHVATYTVEPSVDVLALRERQTGYTDNLGVAHASRSFSSGRVAVGGRVLAPLMQMSYGFTPYAGLYGDWRFTSNSDQPAAVSYAGIGQGWSARVTAGLSTQVWSKGTLSFGGELGGLGANYKTWTGNARLSMPF